LLFAHALAAAIGNDHGLLSHPHLLQTPHYVETVLGADGTFLTFNDTQPFFTGGPILADLGNRLQNALLLWLADYGVALQAGNNPNQIHVNLGSPFRMFLWRGETPSPTTFPGLPTLSTLADLQIGVLRSDPNLSSQLLLGIQGGDGNLTHHTQPDVGSFILQVDEETLVVDPGYYQPSSAAHSLLLVDDTGPQVTGGILVDSRQKEKWRTITVDATQAYVRSRPLKDQALNLLGIQPSHQNKLLSCPAQVRRVFVMSGDEAVVILDDVAIEQHSTVHSLLQTNGQPHRLDPAATAWSVHSRKVSMGIRFFPPDASKLTSSQVKRDFGQSWLFAKLANDGRVDWHTLRLSYSPQVSAPAIMVLTNSALIAPAQVSLSQEEKIIKVHADSKTLAQFAWVDGRWQAQQP
jgi:hypothetical protein